MVLESSLRAEKGSGRAGAAPGTRGTYLEFVRVRSNDRSDLFASLKQHEGWHSLYAYLCSYLL